MTEPLYIINIDPRQSIRDGNYRAVTSILSQKGLPSKLSCSDGFGWWYRPGEELDSETITQLEEIPGVKVKQF